MRHQPHLILGSFERLDGGLEIEKCGDDVAVLGIGLLTHGYPVTVTDRGVDHRITADLQ